jgi:hypothetical protein
MNSSAIITVVTYLTLVTTRHRQWSQPPGISLPHPGKCNLDARAQSHLKKLTKPNKIRVIINPGSF